MNAYAGEGHDRYFLHLTERLGPLRVDRISLPGTSTSFDILRPQDFDRFLDAAAADPEQNLPYWAELWPSGIALAAAIQQAPTQVQGHSVLEIGCGLGVTAVSATLAGARLLATDYSENALALCRWNVQSLTGREIKTLQVNWRSSNTAFWSAVGDRFPIVLAADVLYEDRDIEPLLELVDRVVAPGGTLWLAEPGRRPAARFPGEMENRGWSITNEHCAGPWPDPEDNRKGVVVGLHRLSRNDGG